VDTRLHPHRLRRTTTLFETDYFGNRKAYLTQSGQLTWRPRPGPGQSLLFRADFPSREIQDPRHLTEFWMLETEIAFAELEDILTLAETFIGFIMERVFANRRASWPPWNGHGAVGSRPPALPRLSYTERWQPGSRRPPGSWVMTWARRRKPPVRVL